MNDFFFTDVVNVEIFGSRALEFIERLPHYAEYSVIGFRNTITIFDYRPDSLDALDSILSDDDSVDFGEIFSSVAKAKITIHPLERIRIELFPTSQITSHFELFIAIGLKDSLPVNDYILQKLELFEDGGFAFIGLYKQCQFDDYYSSSLSSSSIDGGHDITFVSSS